MYLQQACALPLQLLLMAAPALPWWLHLARPHWLLPLQQQKALSAARQLLLYRQQHLGSSLIRGPVCCVLQALQYCRNPAGPAGTAEPAGTAGPAGSAVPGVLSSMVCCFLQLACFTIRLYVCICRLPI
jgi:hypothetical protein